MNPEEQIEDSKSISVKLDGQKKVDDHDVIYALRTAHQNQTQLIILADQKANILIGLVAVISTIIFTKATFLVNALDVLMIPLSIFLLAEVLAMLLALLVILPKNISRFKVKRIEDMPNPFFFAFYTNFKESEYVEFMSKSLKDNASARNLLTKDLYQIGQVLKKKYSLLSYAYTSAAVGVILLFASTAIFLFLS